MRRCHPCTIQMLLGILALSVAQGCAVFLSLDEFDESSDAGTPTDSGQDVVDAVDAADAVDVNEGPCSLSITPSSHNFGPIPVGDTSSPVQFTVANQDYDSIGPLTLHGGDPPNPNFTIIAQNCEERTLARGEFCTVDFVFAPTYPGTNQSAVLVIRAGTRDCATAFLQGGAPPI
jgi:hypothetical protein